MLNVTIILAAGLRKNRNTERPCVLDLVNHFPVIYYHIKNALAMDSLHILIVVGKYKDIIQDMVRELFPNCNKIHFIQQKYETRHNQIKAQGTAHAIKTCLSFFEENNVYFETNVLIMSGEGALLSLNDLYKLVNKPYSCSILTKHVIDPTGYGRIVMNDDNMRIDKIIEEKQCTNRERNIKHINCGVYNIQLGVLYKFIPLIKNSNNRQEYCLTDIVEIANDSFIDFINVTI